jgi:hypothetical protein
VSREEAHSLPLIGSQAQIKWLPSVDDRLEFRSALDQCICVSSEKLNMINFTILRGLS